MSVVSLGELVSVQTGKLDANASSPDGAYPFFTCAREPLRIADWKYDLDAILVAGNGDLNVKHYKGKFDAYQRTYILSSKDENRVDMRYLYHFMDTYLETLRAQSIGGIIRYIKLGMLTDAPIPLPPLDEQKRVAAILDQADELRRKRLRAIDRLNRLGQAVFQDMFGARLKSGKPDATIGGISERVTKGESPKWQGHSYVDDGALFVTSENVGWGVMLKKTPKFIPLEFHERKLARSKLRNGDILINLVGASIGRACIFKSSYAEANINQAVAVVTLPRNSPIADYLLTYILSPIGQEQILGSRVEGARANISLKNVRDFEFHMPSSLELERFVQAKSEVAKAIEQADAAFIQSNSLFSSLQNLAFQGDL